MQDLVGGLPGWTTFYETRIGLIRPLDFSFLSVVACSHLHFRILNRVSWAVDVQVGNNTFLMALASPGNFSVNWSSPFFFFLSILIFFFFSNSYPQVRSLVHYYFPYVCLAVQIFRVPSRCPPFPGWFWYPTSFVLHAFPMFDRTMAGRVKVFSGWYFKHFISLLN